MVVNKVLGHFQGTDKTVDRVFLEWFEYGKKRMRKTSEKGREIGICVEEPLREGDILYEDDTTVLVTDLAECALIRVSVSDPVEMGRLCFEIGNRHIPLAIRPDQVTLPYDAPTFGYLKRMGFQAEKITGKFSGYTQCKGHGHDHG